MPLKFQKYNSKSILLLNIDVTHMVTGMLTFEGKQHNVRVPCSTVNSCYITLESFSLKPKGAEVKYKICGM